jgi:hypothetical protein
MPIEFACNLCGKSLKAKDEAAGKRTRCPYCQGVVTVPQLAAVGATATTEGAGAGKPAAEGNDGADEIAVATGKSSFKIVPFSSTTFEAVSKLPPVAEATPSTEPGRTKQYKVLTPKDMGFIAKFDAAKLEETINAWAKQGWTLHTAVVQTHVSHTGTHHDLLVFLER